MFRFSQSAFGDDTVADFEDGIDTISFASSFASALGLSFGDLTIVGNGTETVEVSIGGQTISLTGTAAIQLTADDFAFS